ncbi:FtsW/RodA/SpoVE family cell cycle protein [Phytoactinopolyspora limicola]|uniref:FtsW/RodA/SpoVE family cell cycle protein n=1 Tax=Phytoactinopolyspora limicola TaxID=2715536 RepID=UPI001A9CB69F|nr:FtsW/RodA/SpoVE family cell cycle protein [Phytoactinopolyspora limicola]
MPTLQSRQWGVLTRPGITPSSPARARPMASARTVDVAIVAAVAVLAGLGALNLVTIGASDLALRQLAIVAVGVVIMLVLARWGAAFLSRIGWVLYAGTLLALLVVLAGDDGTRGVRRWIDLGFVTLQPSELAKVAVVVVLAVMLAPGYTRRRFLVALGLAAAPAGLIMLQPDLSTGLVLAAVTTFVILLARVPLLPLLPLFGAVLAVLPLAVLVLRPYQLGRIQAFISGDRDASGSGWAMLQAEIAIALGGVTGTAGEPLHDLRVSYLPEAEHDLAFASIVHSWGLAAGVAVALAVLVIVWRLAVISRTSRSPEGALLAGGVAALLGVQTVVSIAANLGLLPHTGLPIPLFSYGGTAALATLIALGLVLAMRRDGDSRWPLWDVPAGRRRRPRWARSGAVVLTANLLALSYFTWYTQDARADELRAASDEQMTRCVRLPAERGVIEDRTGTPLAITRDEYDVRVLPGMFPDTDDAAVARLADAVGESPDEVQDVLHGRGNELTVTVATVDPDTAGRLTAEELPGVLVAPSERREYPYGQLLGPVLGYVGVGTPEDMQRWPDLPLGATVGRAGLERQYDDVVRGTDGEQCVYVDPVGRPVAAAGRVDPVAGDDLRLHLDLELQELADRSLAAAMDTSGGDVGAAVVMDASTGAILALAGRPGYNNNVYTPPIDVAALRAEVEAPGLPLTHKATQHAAPPGSTFKLVTAAANAEHAIIAPDRVVPTGASYTLGNHTFANWRPMPPHNMIDAIAWSNNVYFYDLAWQLGADRLIGTARQLGVGERTGIDLPGESPGVLDTPESVTNAGGTWYPGATVILGIGQGPVVATPLQAARWTAALSTGELVTPRLAAEHGDGATVEVPEPERLAFAGQLGPVRDGLRAAVTGGTAAQLGVLPVPAGGKTGSAENPASPLSAPDSWFTAVAPVDDPEIVVTTYVRGGGMGSETSGPVALELMQHYFE